MIGDRTKRYCVVENKYVVLTEREQNSNKGKLLINRECYKDEKTLCKIHQGCFPNNCLEDIKRNEEI